MKRSVSPTDIIMRLREGFGLDGEVHGNYAIFKTMTGSYCIVNRHGRLIGNHQTKSEAMKDVRNRVIKAKAKELGWKPKVVKAFFDVQE